MLKQKNVDFGYRISLAFLFIANLSLGVVMMVVGILHLFPRDDSSPRCTTALPSALLFCGACTAATSLLPPLAVANLGPLLAASVYGLSNSGPMVSVAHNVYEVNLRRPPRPGANTLLVDNLAFRDVPECDLRIARWATVLLTLAWNLYGAMFVVVAMYSGNGTTIVRRFLHASRQKCRKMCKKSQAKEEDEWKLEQEGLGARLPTLSPGETDSKRAPARAVSPPLSPAASAKISPQRRSGDDAPRGKAGAGRGRPPRPKSAKKNIIPPKATKRFGKLRSAEWSPEPPFSRASDVDFFRHGLGSSSKRPVAADPDAVRERRMVIRGRRRRARRPAADSPPQSAPPAAAAKGNAPMSNQKSPSRLMASFPPDFGSGAPGRRNAKGKSDLHNHRIGKGPLPPPEFSRK